MENIDEKIWFEYDGCEGRHYMIGNPHTFKGRMYAWCPKKERSFFVSKSEIIKMSVECEYWVKGFLSGNQPEPPTNSEGDVDFESKEYKAWADKVADFENSGYWELEEEND